MSTAGFADDSGAEPDSSSSGCPCSCSIKFDEEEVPESGANVLPGQRITLRLDCGEDTPTDINWSMPTGRIFRSYNASDGAASLSPMEEEYCHESSFFFKPSGGLSEFVPLGIIDWDWGWCPKQDAFGNWDLHNAAASYDTLVPTSIHPEWSGNDVDEPLWLDVPVPCPPPCQ